MFKYGDKIRYLGDTNELLMEGEECVFEKYWFGNHNDFVIVQGLYRNGTKPREGIPSVDFELIKGDNMYSNVERDLIVQNTSREEIQKELEKVEEIALVAIDFGLPVPLVTGLVKKGYTLKQLDDYFEFFDYEVLGEEEGGLK